MTRPETILDLNKLINQIQTRMDRESFVVYVIGNKLDLLQSKDERAQEIRAKMDGFREVFQDFRYFEVSSKTGRGVDELLNALREDLSLLDCREEPTSCVKELEGDPRQEARRSGCFGKG